MEDINLLTTTVSLLASHLMFIYEYTKFQQPAKHTYLEVFSPFMQSKPTTKASTKAALNQLLKILEWKRKFSSF